MLKKQNLIFLLIGALVIAVVSLSIGMSWSLKLVDELRQQTVSKPSGPSILPPGSEPASTPSATPNTTTSVATDIISEPVLATNQLLELLTQEEPQTCNWNLVDPISKQSTSVESYSTPRNFFIIVNPGITTKKTTFILRRATQLYFWQNENVEGLKMTASPVLAGEVPGTNSPAVDVFSELVTKPFHPTCETWVEDSAFFSLPPDLNFSLFEPEKILGAKTTEASILPVADRQDISNNSSPAAAVTNNCAICNQLSEQAQQECFQKCQ